jgi:hypothetical protein
LCALACAAIPACSAAPVASPDPAAVLTIKVVDNIGASAYVLREASVVAQRVFRAAGVQTAWVVCSRFNDVAEQNLDDLSAKNPACYENLADMYIQVVNTPRNDLVPWQDKLQLGAAVFPESGPPGRHSYVLYDRIEKEAETAVCTRISLLGLVMAHEIGHLLLGGGHALEGVMMARWNREIEEKIARGMLLFRADQTKRLRASALAAIGARPAYSIAKNAEPAK